MFADGFFLYCSCNYLLHYYCQCNTYSSLKYNFIVPGKILPVDDPDTGLQILQIYYKFYTSTTESADTTGSTPNPRVC